MKKVSRLIIFLGIQLILYVFFLSLDLKGDSSSVSSVIKFSVIILCFCYVLFQREGNRKRDLSLVQAALFFTLISDFTILFLDADQYIFGVLSFIVVQQLYGIRLQRSRNLWKGLPEMRGFLSSLIFRVAAELTVTIIVLMLLSRFGVIRDRLLTVTVFYFVCLVYNVIRALGIAMHAPMDKSDSIFAAGLVLFLLCDINVGLFNLSGFVSVTGRVVEILYSLSSILMWTFYAPSQVLIAISSDNFRQK